MMRPRSLGPNPSRRYAFGLMEGRIGYVFTVHLHFGCVNI